MDIFACLVERFADHLKTELGIFFNDVFFRVLEGSNFEFHHKKVVLDTIHKLCNTMQFEVDLYLNYDSDFDGDNIFERLINNLSKIAQAIAAREAVSEGWLTPPQAQLLQLKSLESLVNCTNALVMWCTHCDEQKELGAKAAAEAEAEAAAAGGNQVGAGAEGDDDDDADLDALIEKERLATGQTKGMGDQAQRAEDSKRRKDMLIQAVRKFNAKQKHGVLFMQQQGLLPAGTGEQTVLVRAMRSC
eukprot:SAG22_NODE_2106_length_3005_cov_1.999656_2_plen_246_part_00